MAGHLKMKASNTNGFDEHIWNLNIESKKQINRK